MINPEVSNLRVRDKIDVVNEGDGHVGEYFNVNQPEASITCDVMLAGMANATTAPT